MARRASISFQNLRGTEWELLVTVAWPLWERLSPDTLACESTMQIVAFESLPSLAFVASSIAYCGHVLSRPMRYESSRVLYLCPCYRPCRWSVKTWVDRFDKLGRICI